MILKNTLDNLKESKLIFFFLLILILYIIFIPKIRIENYTYYPEKNLTNPTLKELKRILLENNYLLGDCVISSIALQQDLMNEGYYSCRTYIEFENKSIAHSIIAVNTKDKGIVYVEPQTKVIVTDLNIGEDYCKKFYFGKCFLKIKRIASCYGIKG